MMGHVTVALAGRAQTVALSAKEDQTTLAASMERLTLSTMLVTVQPVQPIWCL